MSILTACTIITVLHSRIGEESARGRRLPAPQLPAHHAHLLGPEAEVSGRGPHEFSAARSCPHSQHPPTAPVELHGEHRAVATRGHEHTSPVATKRTLNNYIIIYIYVLNK